MQHLQHIAVYISQCSMLAQLSIPCCLHSRSKDWGVHDCHAVKFCSFCSCCGPHSTGARKVTAALCSDSQLSSSKTLNCLASSSSDQGTSAEGCCSGRCMLHAPQGNGPNKQPMNMRTVLFAACDCTVFACTGQL